MYYNMEYWDCSLPKQNSIKERQQFDQLDANWLQPFSSWQIAYVEFTWVNAGYPHVKLKQAKIVPYLG